MIRLIKGASGGPIVKPNRLGSKLFLLGGVPRKKVAMERGLEIAKHLIVNPICASDPQ